MNGMLSALAYEGLQAFAQGHVPVVKVASETVAGIDPDLTFLVRCASHFERPFTLLEVQSELPLHLILAYTTDNVEQPVTALGFALSADEALKQALTSLVGQLQYLKYEGTRPALDENAIPRIALSPDLINSDTVSNGRSTPDVSFEQVKQYLQEQGRKALFINLTTSDFWEKGPLMSGTVLLTRGTTS